MDQLRIGEVRQKLELVSLLGLVGVVDAEILDVLLLEFHRQAVHDVGSVAGIAHVAVGIDIAEVDGSLVHHFHVGTGGDFSAGQSTEFGGKGRLLPQGKVRGTHDAAVLDVYQHPGATAGHQGLVVLVVELVAAGELKSCRSLLPGADGEGLVRPRILVDSQAHPGNQYGEVVFPQYRICHSPLVEILHSAV